MSPWTPINARQVEEKKLAQARRCHWCVILGPLEKRHKYGYPEGCRCKDKTQRRKEEDASVKAETKANVEGETKATVNGDTEAESEAESDTDTEATVRVDNKGLLQAAARPPAVNKRARRTSKVNNRKTCTRCDGKEFNMSNFRDHEKVHYLEDSGVPARFPCTSCKEPGKCRVARYPQRLGTYACISCLRSHSQCSFNKLKAKKPKICNPGQHPALLHPVN